MVNERQITERLDDTKGYVARKSRHCLNIRQKCRKSKENSNFYAIMGWIAVETGF